MAEKKRNPRLGVPVQVYIDESLKVDFERVIENYDTGLSLAGALKKLIAHSVHRHWLPGYIEKPRVFQNDSADVKDAVRKALDNKE